MSLITHHACHRRREREIEREAYLNGTSPHHLHDICLDNTRHGTARPSRNRDVPLKGKVCMLNHVASTALNCTLPRPGAARHSRFARSTSVFCFFFFCFLAWFWLSWRRHFQQPKNKPDTHVSLIEFYISACHITAMSLRACMRRSFSRSQSSTRIRFDIENVRG